jgi:two-component system chemotaxis sensor kinase CheA
LVLTVGSNQFGLLVDEVLDTEDIVVKPLSCFLQGNPCFSGTTIMGDGSVAMICDATGIANHSQLDFSGVEAEQLRRNEAKERTQRLQAQEHNVALDSQSLLLFCNHSHEPIAVPLNEVLRLEQISTKDIEHIGQREFILHQGHTIALIRLEDYLNLEAPEETHDEVFLIVPSAGQGRIGIVVSHIIDTLDTTLHLDTHFIEAPYLYGSALIQDKVTLLLNLNELLESQSVLQDVAHDTVTL